MHVMTLCISTKQYKGIGYNEIMNKQTKQNILTIDTDFFMPLFKKSFQFFSQFISCKWVCLR